MTDTTPTPATPEQIAERRAQAAEIIEQFGGRRFIAMVGARDFVFEARSEHANILFKFMGSRKATHVKIEENGLDLYTVTFTRVRSFKINPVKTFENVYFDSLKSIFEDVTGLATTFPVFKNL